jgi:hypothetical protein
MPPLELPALAPPELEPDIPALPAAVPPAAGVPALGVTPLPPLPDTAELPPVPDEPPLLPSSGVPQAARAYDATTPAHDTARSAVMERVFFGIMFLPGIECSNLKDARYRWE